MKWVNKLTNKLTKVDKLQMISWMKILTNRQANLCKICNNKWVMKYKMRWLIKLEIKLLIKSKTNKG